MGFVKVQVAEGRSGVFVGQRGQIIPFDHGSANEKLRTMIIPAEDVAQMVLDGSIEQPSDEQMNGGDGAEDRGSAERLAGIAAEDKFAGIAAAGLGAGDGDERVVTTGLLTNFPPDHPSRQDSAGLPGATSAADAEAAADHLDPDDDDAPPADGDAPSPRRRRGR